MKDECMKKREAIYLHKAGYEEPLNFLGTLLKMIIMKIPHEILFMMNKEDFNMVTKPKNGCSKNKVLLPVKP